MANPDEVKAELSRMDAMRAGFKRALTWFLVFDAVFVAGAVTLWFWLVRPNTARLEAARDAAVRANAAMVVRVHAVEGRLALATGDTAGAAAAAEQVKGGLAALSRIVPKDRTLEQGEIANLLTRAGLIADELARDPESARKDFELIDARLGAAYPGPTPAN